jgi:lysophospholipase L1-like esterase
MSIRIFFFGDSIVNGTGDDACLGWVGRICSAARRRGIDLTCYNLGIRRDTSTDILARWQIEARARLPDQYDGRLVFSFGANDCCPGDDVGGVRVAPERAIANANAILQVALAWRPTLMVGPLPICDEMVDPKIRSLSAGFAALCSRLNVLYLDMFDFVAASSIWRDESAAGDGVHPNEGGYGLVARTIDARPEWRDWIR